MLHSFHDRQKERTVLFNDRTDAGQRLAEALAGYSAESDLLVIALPRGGVPVAYEIAGRLGAPLDVRYVRKIGAPGQPEFAMGAIASGGIEVLNRASVRALRLTCAQVAALVAQGREELSRHEHVLRSRFPSIPAAGKNVILVDDGLATGSTMRAALQALQQEGPRRITVAVPVGAASVLREFGRIADAVICLHAPVDFDAVSRWYRNFEQVSDDEVQDLLTRARANKQP